MIFCRAMMENAITLKNILDLHVQASIKLLTLRNLQGHSATGFEVLGEIRLLIF